MKATPLLRSSSVRRPSVPRGFALLAGLLAGLVPTAPPTVRAQSAAAVSTLHTFDGLAISSYRGTLVSGGDGNFYGVNNTVNPGTDGSISNDAGQVFKLAPDGTVTTLYRFGYPNNDNSYSPLVRGRDGAFYGAAFNGGPKGLGFIYKITPDGVFTDLHDFSGDSDGGQPAAALVEGSDGSFYGTNLGGGYYDGVIFKITPAGEFTILHEFTGYDGFDPFAPLVEGRDGNFYGTTDGVINGKALGTVYKITPTGEFVDLYHFGAGDGNFPNSTLVEGYDGNFYGTTTNGPNGADGSSALNTGTVFRVTPEGKFTTLHTFTGGSDGGLSSGLTLGGDGNFYGTTEQGGLYGRHGGDYYQNLGDGTIYQITPAGVLTTLYNFSGGTDGRNPAGPLIKDGDHGFLGTTGGDGTTVAGTLFRLAVNSHPAFFTRQQSVGLGVYYLQLATKNSFGYYAFLDDPNYLYHFDLGYEYVLDANDGLSGVFLYDYASGTFFYTSPTFPFPYLYDFTLNAFLYYFPDPTNPQRYNTDGVRYFYNFSTGKIISK